MYFKTIATLAACAIALPSLAEQITVSTYAGEATVEANPETIAVLDVTAIDMLDALGVEIDGAPENLYVGYLGDVAERATVVGSLFEPDYEALAILGPDLIVAGGRSSRVADQLAKVAPTVDMTIWGQDHVDQALIRLKGLGAITGTEVQAAEVEAAFLAKIDVAKAVITGKGDALILMTNGPTVSAFGQGSRFGWIHSALDLPEAVEGVDEQTHGEAVSFEFIAEANPDWLIVVDRAAAIGADGEAAAATLDNALVAGTKAGQAGQIVYLNAPNIYIAGGGVQSMSGTLDELIAAFGN